MNPFDLLRHLATPNDPDLCPPHLVEAFQRYVQYGVPPGDFLQAVLRNDLTEAIGRADHENLILLPAIVSYVYNRMPHNCHGSGEIVAAWIAARAAEVGDG